MEKFSYTYDPKEAAKYDGFIAPDGRFYKVSKKGKHNPTHYDFADYFVLNETDFVKDLAKASMSFLFTLSRLGNDKVKILIHFYGYIYYGHDEYTDKEIILYPNYDVNNQDVTEEQKQMLFDTISVVKNKADNLCIEDNNEESIHDRYVDNFIERRLEEELRK